MTAATEHRLDGLEPDNLLAFLALLGLMRTLEAARPEWRPRVGWTVDDPPVRPVIRLRGTTTIDAVLTATAAGLADLARDYDFYGARDLSFTVAEARERLTVAARASRRRSDVWASLLSDAAASSKGDGAEPTPLCLLFGQGHQHFLERLASVPKLAAPPPRGDGRRKTAVSEAQCLREALLVRWERPDATPSFRWDPNEDVRYALRAHDPTDPKTKETTQHGANRLAAVGLACLTVVPMIRRGAVRLDMIGGRRDARGGFAAVWPIWRHPLSLPAIIALLDHPKADEPEVREALGITERRRAKRISAGKFMNFTRGEAI